MQRLKYLAVVEQSSETVLDNGLETQVGLLPDQHFHFLSRHIVGFFLRQITVDLGRSHNPETFFVQMNVNDITLAHLHFHLLLAERHKKVLHQAPVQKSSILVDPGYLQTSKLAYLHQRLLRSGHQTFFVVQIDKDIQFVAYLAILRHVAFGQKNLTLYIIVEIHTEIHLLHDLQSVEFS